MLFYIAVEIGQRGNMRKKKSEKSTDISQDKDYKNVLMVQQGCLPQFGFVFTPHVSVIVFRVISIGLVTGNHSFSCSQNRSSATA